MREKKRKKEEERRRKRKRSRRDSEGSEERKGSGDMDAFSTPRPCGLPQRAGLTTAQDEREGLEVAALEEINCVVDGAGGESHVGE